MDDESFRAWVVTETADGRYERHWVQRHLSNLPLGDVLVRVYYSSLNYKDALSASGNKSVTRKYPHTPGIDAAGVVVESTSAAFKVGDNVIIGSAEFGANAPGGFSEYVRVPAAWLTPLPTAMTLRQSMIYGTAGITAALSLLRLQEQGLELGDGEVLVTGATGGVGSMAVALLAHLGYHVVAGTGKASAHEWLVALGAQQVLDRAVLNDTSGKALLKARWAGVVDTVGGNYLTTALKSTRYGGVVTCCGNVGGPELITTVYPFILRGVRLVGIDVANCAPALRQDLWRRLAGGWGLPDLESMSRECMPDMLTAEIDRMLQGQQTGRVIVNLVPTNEQTGV
jgi:alcohol dehydrogenase